MSAVRGARLVMSQAEIEADRDGWLDERRWGAGPAGHGDGEPVHWRLTASDMAAVLGLSSHSSPYSLYWEKVTGHSTFEGSDRTDLGLYLEDYTAQRFADHYEWMQVGPGGLYVSRTYPWLAATPDRLGAIGADCYPVQLKSWANRNDFGPAGTAVMPVALRVQLLTEMIVLDAETGYMPVCFLPGGTVRTYVIERDKAAEQDMAAILKAGQQFIAMLDEERPPEVDWHEATTTTLRARFTKLERRQVEVPPMLARRFFAARRAVAKAQRKLDQARNELRAAMGDADTAVARRWGGGGPAVVCTRTGGPVAGYSVAPRPWREAMNAGDWDA